MYGTTSGPALHFDSMNSTSMSRFEITIFYIFASAFNSPSMFWHFSKVYTKLRLLLTSFSYFPLLFFPLFGNLMMEEVVLCSSIQDYKFSYSPYSPKSMLDFIKAYDKLITLFCFYTDSTEDVTPVSIDIALCF